MTDLRAIETRYKGYRFRSRLEARWAVFFDALGVSWEYEPEGYVLPNGVRYLPDFRVHLGVGHPMWFEIKPDRDKWPSHPVWEVSEKILQRNPAYLRFVSNFVLLAGEPFIGPDPFYPTTGGKPHYSGYTCGDCGYLFCECHMCGALGIQFEGRGARIPCACDHSQHGNGDKCYAPFSARLQAAYRAARSARFEHGESGARV